MKIPGTEKRFERITEQQAKIRELEEQLERERQLLDQLLNNVSEVKA